MDFSEDYLEELQLLFSEYRQGKISKEQLEVRRLELMDRSRSGLASRRLLSSRGSLLIAAAICSLFLVTTLGFAGLGPTFEAQKNRQIESQQSWNQQ